MRNASVSLQAKDVSRAVILSNRLENDRTVRLTSFPFDPDIAGYPTLTPIYMDIPIPHRAA